MKEIDWANLSFGYMKTDYNVRCYYRDGAWGELELCSEETLNIHMAATCLHYGQEALIVEKTVKSVFSVLKPMRNVCKVLVTVF